LETWTQLLTGNQQGTYELLNERVALLEPTMA